MSETPDILDRAEAVLRANDRGTYTIPAGDLYPHQWLWDSCFIAIGIRHYDVERANGATACCRILFSPLAGTTCESITSGVAGSARTHPMA
jgi:hypothetical protein